MENFFAWITVSYQLSVQQAQGVAVTMQNQQQNQQMTVLLVATPFNTPRNAPPTGGIGWLVSAYNAENTLPPIPAHP